MVQQILLYWLIAQVIGLAGLPLARLLFAALPHQGYPFAKILGLLAGGWLAWLLAMLGLAPFNAILAAVCILAIALAGMLAHPAGRPLAIRAWLLANWRTVLAYELFFTIALLYLAIQRSFAWEFVGPHPWGTERPMDFAFFNAIQRSSQFPPHDPWMAGYSINYYYGGYLLMALVAMLSAVPAGVGYNLSLALIFALTAQGVAGIVVALIGLARGYAGRTAWLAALLAVVVVLFAGNQTASLQIVTGTEAVSILDGNDLARAIANGLGPRTTLQFNQTYRGEIFGPEGATSITPTDRLTNFNWWYPTRALYDRTENGRGELRNYAITEWPFFSFWLGDMHPHVMSLPFTLLALALALASAVRPDLPGYGRGMRGWLELLGSAVVLGALYFINSWDFPTYLLLILAALLLNMARQRASTGITSGWLGIDWRGYALVAGPLVVAALLLYLPFYLTFVSLVGARAALIDLPIIGTLTKTIGIVGWPKTPLHTFVIINGLLFLPTLAWASPRALAGSGLGAPWVIVLATLALGTVVGFPLIACVPLAFYLGQAALVHARSEKPVEAFVLATTMLVALISVGVDIVYLRDLFDNRMNSIFKFYYQIWLILGTLAGYTTWAMIQGIRTQRQTAARWVLALQTTALVLTGLFLISALVYPWMTLSQLYTKGTQIGLNGSNPRGRDDDGAAALEWMRQNIPGDAVILEAVGDPFNSYDTIGEGIAGVSSSTGLATVMGWPGHQNQWRGGAKTLLDQIEPRRQDVITIYSTTDINEARRLLNQYHVRYVYVGPPERNRYPPEGLAKFDTLGTVAFQQGNVTIYSLQP